MRPVGPDDKTILPRPSSVGDGPKPSADARILKRGQAPALAVPAIGAASPGAKPASSPALQGGAGVPLAAGSVPVSPAQLCAALRIPAEASSFLALSAMLGERLPLDAGIAASIRRALRRHDGDPAAARIAARAIAAGFDPEGDAVERLLSVLDPSDDDKSGSGRGSSEDSSHHDTGDRDPYEGRGCGDGGSRNGERRDEGRREPTGDRQEADDTEALGESLRASVAASMGDPDMAALSAPDADGGRWICVPFEVPFDGVDFKGFIRIWYSVAGRRSGRLIADIRCGDGRRLLEIAGTPGVPIIKYHADDASERASFLAVFGGNFAVMAATLAEGDLAELEVARRIEADA